jgi:hypothetical protein
LSLPWKHFSRINESGEIEPFNSCWRFLSNPDSYTNQQNAGGLKISDCTMIGLLNWIKSSDSGPNSLIDENGIQRNIAVPPGVACLNDLDQVENIKPFYDISEYAVANSVLCVRLVQERIVNNIDEELG